MNPPDRADKIQSILAARQPMADRTHEADEILNKIDNQLRSFREFVPVYAKRLDSDAASRINALVPEAEEIIAKIAQEKGKLALLSARFTRPTLNIGVAGRAGQGKSTLLQKLTGLTTEEIPTGDKGHCTGAPSIIVNHDSNETFAEITFHTAQSFLESVIAPFFQRLGLGAAPYTLDQFAKTLIPEKASVESTDPTTDAEHLKKLRNLQINLKEYKTLLTGEKLRKNRDEIRSFVAQEDVSGNQKLTKWFAVQMATIYCRFPHSDVGTIALADTPGLGDFLSGAEDRLVKTVGRTLDVVLFVRRPPVDRAVIEPGDTGLHGLISRAIPDLPVSDWSYFVINKAPENASKLDYFEGELQKSEIRTRMALRVDCKNDDDVSRCLDEILNDVAGNLASLDKRLIERQGQGIKALASSIVAFAEKAQGTLPKATVVAPDLALLHKLFGTVWTNIGAKLQELVNASRQRRDKPDEDFLAAVKSVFDKLDSGPDLPPPEVIAKEAAAPGFGIWHAHKLHELRVNLSNSFEELNSCLDASFERLKNEVLSAFTAEDGGKLGRLDREDGKNEWQNLRDRWEGHEGGEIMRHAIETLCSAGLSFRGFIQPRVRQCIDVLDGDSAASKNFGFIPGDSAEDVKEKLELAWENASFNCREAIDKMAKEPSMARFAAVEDFRDAVLHTGGEDQAKAAWMLFYHDNRGDVWPEQFEKLDADTHLRKEWEKAVRSLKDAASSLSVAF